MMELASLQSNTNWNGGVNPTAKQILPRTSFGRGEAFALEHKFLLERFLEVEVLKSIFPSEVHSLGWLEERERAHQSQYSGMKGDLASTWEQTLDKERDIRGLESNARVPYSGLAQAQLMGGKNFTPLTKRGHYLPFVSAWCP